MPKKEMPPGEGERRAQVGYGGQYRVQACLVIRALREGNLDWIKIADPEAKKLDDFQLGSPGRVDAYQIKWAAHPSPITFQKLTTGEEPLVSQLAEGRKAIKLDQNDARVVAHFVTNDHPSTSDEVPTEKEAKPRLAHFSAFLKQVWEPLKCHTRTESNLPEPWKVAWSKFGESSGLNRGEFSAFVSDLELEFDFHAEPPSYATGRERERLENDISTIASFFSKLVAAPERVIQLTGEELLSRLGWSGRYEFRNQHDFPVDFTTYQPLEETVNSLDAALVSLSRGYVCVLGSPGSGKSTLLTQTLRLRRERVIKYYAFVRDDFGPTNSRGESENFLHDLTLFLDRAGFRRPSDTPQPTRQELSKAFRSQLQMLGEDFRTSGRKTIILVDGLDHVKREQAAYINQDFFGDFPLPNQVPEGVLFVFGTQTLSPLPPQIQSHLEADQSRLIRTQPLSRTATGTILARAGLGTLSPSQFKRTFDLCGGHPLALHYILEQLVAHPGDADGVLESAPDFKGDIEDTYRSYWDDISKGDSSLKKIMGLIARLRPAIDLEWVRTWADPHSFDRLKTEFSHYFSREGERWFFFHNSFRRFLITITARTASGEFCKHENKRFHRELAKLCQESKTDHAPWRWEQIYHWSEAEEHGQVLAAATQAFFRDQFFDSRPAPAILNDILLARKSLPHVSDPVAAVRLSLARTEIARRFDELSTSSPTRAGKNLMIATGHVHAAVATVRQGMHLLTTESDAIHWCQDFLDAGLVTEAKQIFSLIDPLTAARKFYGMHPQRDEQRFLVDWALVALHPRARFRDIDEVLATIKRFEFTTDNRRRLALETPADLRSEVFAILGEGLIRSGRSELLDQVKQCLDADESRYHVCIHRWEFMRASEHFKAGRNDEAIAVLNGEVNRLATNQVTLNLGHLLDTAELYAQLGQQGSARHVMGKVKCPEIVRDSWGEGRAFIPWFRYHRLKYYLGSIERPEDVVPDAESPQQEGIVQLKRELCTIAWIWGQAWNGNMLTVSGLEPLLRPLLDFFDCDEVERMDWDFALEIKHARSQFYSWLIGAFCAHGNEAMTLLGSTVAADWNDGRKRRYWYAHFQRDFVTELSEKGMDSAWTCHWLETIESEIYKTESSTGRVSEYAAQAQAWLIAGRPERAEKMRKCLMRSSFGIGYRKDYQLQTWLRLIIFFLNDHPEKALDLLRWVAKCIAGLELAVDSDTTRSAAGELASVCISVHPCQAVAFLKWFRDKSLLWNEDALSGILVAFLKMKDAPTEEIFLSVRDLFIPIAKEGNWYLMERLVVKVCDAKGPEEALTDLRSLLTSISAVNQKARERWQFGLVRGALLSGISIEKIGLSREVLRRGADDRSGDNLECDGGVKTMDELEFANLSLADLKSLYHRPTSGNHFNWHRLISRVASHFKKNELMEITELFCNDRKFSLVVEAISKSLVKLGGIIECRTLARKGIEKSNPEGWNRFHDGGTRLAGFKTWLETDREAALPAFYNECATEDPLELENYEAILPLISDPSQQAQIWQEIEEHLRQLLEGCDEGIEEPPMLPQSPEPIAAQLRSAILEVFPRN